MSGLTAGNLEDYSVDQLAGAIVLILGAVGSLLLVVWQSKCHCKVNLCYLFQCERRPPNEEEMKTLKDQAKKQNEKLKKTNKKQDTILEKEEGKEEVVSPRLVPKKNISVDIQPEPQAEQQRELDKLV